MKLKDWRKRQRPTRLCPKCTEEAKRFGCIGPVGGSAEQAGLWCQHGVRIDMRDYIAIVKKHYRPPVVPPSDMGATG